MQGDNNDKETECSKSKMTMINRRKRVNRIKVIIVATVIILLILPTISCIIMGFKINQLQRQVNEITLYSEGKEVKIKSRSSGNDNIAYAAEKDQKKETVDNINDGTHILNSYSFINKSILEASNDNVDMMKDEISTGKAGLVKEELVKEELVKEELVQKEVGKEELGKEELEQKEKVSNKKGIYYGKKVYLTFDDGPSQYTDDILDILAEYKVKATFFVIGMEDEFSKEMYRRIIDEGHTLGMHSYTHIYDNIYNSLEDFDKDFTKLWELLYDITGHKSTLFRFPGGSANSVSKIDKTEIIKYLNEKSIIYFDWNVVSGDATGEVLTKEQLVENVLNGVALKNTPIVLMHDSITKKATIDSLAIILEALITQGAEVLPLDEGVPLIQQIIASSIE